MKKLLSIFSFLFLITFLSSCTSLNQTQKLPQKSPYNNFDLSESFTYQAPGSWQKVAPSESMREAEYIIDPVSQTALAVFFFPRMMNMVDLNIDRWQNQFDPQDRKLISQKQFNIGKLPVTEFFMKGTYLKPSNALDPQSEKTALKDHAIHAFIVETQQGMWFFKAYGPFEVINGQEDNFNKLSGSFTPSI